MDHNHHLHKNPNIPTTGEKIKLSVSATAHCLLGCGLGEIVGVILGTALALSNVHIIILAISLGFVFGFALGLIPLLKARFQLKDAVRQVESREIGVLKHGQGQIPVASVQEEIGRHR